MNNPAHPGEILKEYLKDITITDAALKLRVSRTTVSRLLNRKNSITIDMALRLAESLNTSPEFWINLQAQYDVEVCKHRKRPFVDKII